MSGQAEPQSNRPQIRDWINIIGGIVIGFALIYGITVFLKDGFYDPEKGLHNLFPFAPSLVSSILLVIFRIIAGGDVSSNMCLLLISLGFGFLVSGFFIKNEASKNACFGAAGGFLGLGLGVPFGDFMKRREQ
jgi:hypothetical protein